MNKVSVIRPKAIRCPKALTFQKQSSIGSTSLLTVKENVIDQQASSPSSLGDLKIDFDKIQSEYLFSDLMDFDGLGCGNVMSLVSSDEVLGDYVSADASCLGNLDLNRPFTSCLQEDCLWDFNC